jgi:hypothetical protein
MYEHGQGVTADDIEAAKWYRLAAGQGDEDAMRNLAIVVEERESKLAMERHHLGGSDMIGSPTEWFGEMMHKILGLGESMTAADIGLIALVVLIVMIPVVMSFSFYRIKPLMQQLSDDDATRDQALLGELRNLNALLQQQATDAAERGQAQTEELRKMTRAFDAGWSARKPPAAVHRSTSHDHLKPWLCRSAYYSRRFCRSVWRRRRGPALMTAGPPTSAAPTPRTTWASPTSMAWVSIRTTARPCASIVRRPGKATLTPRATWAWPTPRAGVSRKTMSRRGCG